MVQADKQHEADTPEIGSSEFIRHLRNAEQQSRKRHEENIQILVALGILAGYITAFFNGMFEAGMLNLLATIFFITNFGFLFYKLLTHTSIPITELSSSNSLDPIINLLYLISIVGFSVILLVSVATRQFSMSFSDFDQLAGYIPGIITPTFVLGLWYIMGRKEKRTTESYGTALLEEMPNALEMLVEDETISSSEKESLQDRLATLLQRDDGIGWFQYGGIMIDQSPVRIDRQNREQLLNILSRIKTKAKHEQYDREDYEVIESIVAEAEQQT